MCHPGAPECQITAQQQRRLPRLAGDRNRLHFPGQSQRHSGFGLGFSLGNGGSEPRETLRLWAGLLEPRPASGPRWTQGPSHRLEEEAGGVPGAPRGGGGRPEPWPRPAPQLGAGAPAVGCVDASGLGSVSLGLEPVFSGDSPTPAPARQSASVPPRARSSGHSARAGWNWKGLNESLTASHQTLTRRRPEQWPSAPPPEATRRWMSLRALTSIFVTLCSLLPLIRILLSITTLGT